MPKSNKEEAVATASPKAAFIAVAIGGILLAATIAAYLGRIPTEIRAIPFYDSIGHFVLFGTLAAALDRVFRERMMRGIPVAAWSVGSYAILDESLQSLSSMRTFSLGDLAAGLIGVAAMTALGRYLRLSKGIRESAAKELRK
ncbi:MAG TPA: VanZ family protein [Candidatus Paceibacterota bacterium]|nr:VanZ family protein [Candidatus Paceibacterota bacterium]